MSSTDAQLVRALDSRKAEKAARALYRAHGPELFAFAARRLGDRGLAEEVVQDVFTKAWRHAGAYDPDRGSVRTWLFGIARNTITDAERRRGRRPPTTVLDEPAEQATSDEPIERAMLRWQLDQAFSRLTADHQQVLRMAHVHGHTLSDIAERSGLPLGTVKSRVHYAMQNLRLILQELELTP